MLALGVLAAMVVATDARAFEIKHAPSGNLVRWSRPNVSWTIDRSVQEVLGGEGAVRTAVDAWSGQGGAPSLTVADDQATLVPGFDRVNGIFFMPEGFGPAGDALAVTILSYDERTGEILDADIILNGKYHFAPVEPVDPETSTLAATGAPATYDVGRVVAHEMGHALGLSDEPAQKAALMYPYIARSSALPTAPATDDVNGLEALYVNGPRLASASASADDDESMGTRTDGPSRGAGCVGAIIAPSGPRSAPRGSWVVAGLAVLALALARRAGKPGPS